jgi:hypothetical protein
VAYLLRAGRKGAREDEIRDLKKAVWYIQRELALIEERSR